jgi:DnaJ-class molecular chaperone
MTETIVICDRCKGFGKIENSEVVDYHNNISDYWDEKCLTCDGSGRMVLVTSTRKLTSSELKLRSCK